MSWCWTDERAAHLHASGAACRARAVSLDGAVLSGAVRLRAEDRDVANRIAQPPYVPVFDLAAGWEKFSAALGSLSVENFKLLISDNLYILSYVRSLIVALTSTAILLLIGYPWPMACRGCRDAGSRSP
jgi:ABC-type glycerol-3-phosphate transport system permease component